MTRFVRPAVVLCLLLVSVAAVEAQSSCPAAPSFRVAHNCSPVPSTGAVPCGPSSPAQLKLVDSGGAPIVLQSCQSVTWIFGDGSPSATTTSPTVSHAYAKGGWFEAQATIQSTGGSYTSQKSRLFSAAGWFDASVQYFGPGKDEWPREGREPAAVFRFTRNSGEGTASLDYNTPPDHPLAGQSFVATSGRLTFQPGETSKSVAVPILNDNVYRGHFQLHLFYRTATPTYAPRANTDNAWISLLVDDDDRPRVRFAAPSFRASENGDTVDVKVKVEGQFVSPLQLNYQYNGLNSLWSGSWWVMLQPGDTEKTFSISFPFPDDELYSEPRKAVLRFSSSLGLDLDGSTELIVEDDEPVPVISIADVRLTEPTTSENRVFVAKIHSTQPAADDTPLVATFEPGTAGTADFKPSPDITLRALQTEIDLPFVIVGDNVPEGTETFTIHLRTAGGPGVIGDGTAKVTIDDDDIGSSLTVNDRSVLAGESVQFRLTLPNTVSGATRINLESSDPSVFNVPLFVTMNTGGATVTFTGTARQPGSATIRALVPDGSPVSTDVTVFTLDVSLGDETFLRMLPGEQRRIAPRLTPAPPTPMSFELRSSDATVVAVPDAFRTALEGSFPITALRPGTAVITFRTLGGTIEKTLTVLVEGGFAVNGITPATGPTAGGTAVTVSGSRLAADCRILFGGTEATAVTATGAGTLTARTPAHASGAVDVEVVCGDSRATLPGAFTYVKPRSRAVRH